MEKNIIEALKKLDTSYNPVSINYINDKFNDMTIEDKSQKKAIINQEPAHFIVLSSAYGKSKNFQEAWNNKYP